MENDPDRWLIAYGRLNGHIVHQRFILEALDQKLSRTDVIERCIRTLFECGNCITIISPDNLNLSKKLTMLDSLAVESITLFREVLARDELKPVARQIHEFFRSRREEACTIDLHPADPFVVMTQRVYWYGRYRDYHRQYYHRFGRDDAASEMNVGRSDITEWIRRRNRKKPKIEPVLLSYRNRMSEDSQVPDVESILEQCAAIAESIRVQTIPFVASFPEEAASIDRAVQVSSAQTQLMHLEEAASPGDPSASRRQRELAMHAALHDPDPKLNRLKNPSGYKGGINVSDRNAWKRDRSKQSDPIERMLGERVATAEDQKYRVMFRIRWRTPVSIER